MKTKTCYTDLWFSPADNDKVTIYQNEREVYKAMKRNPHRAIFVCRIDGATDYPTAIATARCCYNPADAGRL